MLAKKQIAYVFSPGAFKGIGSNSLIALGSLWFAIEFTSFFFPDLIQRDVWTFIFAIAISLVFAVIQTIPPVLYIYKSKASGIEIEIKVGSLLDQNCDVAVGTNNFFETESKDVIAGRSIKSKLIKQFFRGDPALLDQAISKSLNEQGIKGSINHNKTFGKTCCFPIGTVAIVRANNHNCFLTVFVNLSVDGVNVASKDDLWLSLSSLWRVVRQHCSSDHFAVPVWGSGIARFPSSRLLLIQLLLISFATATKEGIVTRKLSIMIHEKDYDPAEMIEFIQVLKALEF